MKFIAIGELMLRLSPPNYDKIVTTHNFIVNYGGAEANVAVSLANLGVDSTFFTVLPNTDLGKSCINYLKANDVHTKHIIKADVLINKSKQLFLNLCRIGGIKEDLARVLRRIHIQLSVQVPVDRALEHLYLRDLHWNL